MDKRTYKKLKKLIDKIREEAEYSDITFAETESLIIKLLGSKGFTLEEYEEFEKPIKIEETQPDMSEALSVLKGKRGEKGETPTKEELLELVKPLIPKAKDGKNGRDGRDGVDGKPGRTFFRGKEGKPGKDGKSVNIEELKANTNKLVKTQIESQIGSPLFGKRVLDMTVEQQERIIEPVRRGLMGLRGEIGRLSASISSENLWDRTGTTITQHTANDNLDLGSGTLEAGAITGTSFIIGGDTLATLTKVATFEALADAAGVLTSDGGGNYSWGEGGGGASQLSDLSDVVSATNTDKFALMANGTTGYVGRALAEADISDLGAYLTSVAYGDLTGNPSDVISAGTGLSWSINTLNAEVQTSDLHAAVTIGTANGLSLSTQALSLAVADTDTTGALSYTDWNTFNSKLANINSESADELSDVDTTTDTPDKSEVLKWNGTNWVPAAYNYNFTFSIASFSDGEATTQLIGDGEWEANEAVIFAATYNNGPPTSANVLMSINGAAYNDVGNMDSTAYTAGKSYDGAINYPAAKDQYLRFRLDATDGVDPDIEYETAVYFRNYGYYGAIAKSGSFTEADIEGLTPAYATNSNKSVAINAGAGEYIVWAFPTTYTALDEGSDYETDGGTDFKFNSIAIAMTQDNATLSITNSAGYTENYDVYVSDLASLGNHTFVANTSDQTIDPLYYGITEKTDTFLEADIEGLTNHPVTNDNTQVWSSVTTGVGEYMLFAFPKRLGTVSFWVGGFEGGFEAPETVSVTNVNGWTEDYYVWRSSNSNLGVSNVTTT